MSGKAMQVRGVVERWGSGHGAGGGAWGRRRAAALWRRSLSVLPLVPLLAGCGGERVVEEPVPLYGEVPVEYPLDLWDAGVDGETLLRVRVTEMGEVDSVEVVTASGYPAFDSAAVRGARQLRYEPAREDGKRIRVWAKVPVHFTHESG